MTGRDGDPGRGPVPATLSRLDAELAAVERRVVARLDPGVGAVVLACAVMLLIVAAVLPWVGGASGWEVLLSGAHAGVLPRVFSVTAIGFGVLGSALGLLTRRWGVAAICALGCGFSVVDGVLAVWSRQTAPGGGPGVGMVLALVAILVLTAQWLRLVWSRP